MRFLSMIDSLSALGPVLVDAALRGAVVLLAALVLTWMLRRNNAALRHLIWVGAIVIQILLPLFALWGPTWRVAVPTAIASAVPPTAQAVIPLAPAPVLPTSTVESHNESTFSTSQRQSVASVPVSPRLTAPQWLMLLWALGALIVLVRLAVGTALVARLARRGYRIDDGNWLALAQRLSASLGLGRPLTLMRGDRLGVPVTWGIVYPVVLLPEDADAWPEERRRFVLVHEMAHVKRLDALTQLVGQFALALFWFNPLVWLANRRMQLEREHACDDYVIRQGTTPSLYAEELLTMVRSLGEPQHRSAQPAFAALAMARRTEFEGRMLSILDPRLNRHPLSRMKTVLSAMVALLLVVPLAALRPYREVQVTRVPEAKPAPALANAVAERARELAQVKKGLESTKVELNEVTPAAPVVPPRASGFTMQSCDNTSSSGTHINANDDGDGSVVITYLAYDNELCASATIIGKLKYAADESDILEMPQGAQATFRERAGGVDRELTFNGNRAYAMLSISPGSTPPRNDAVTFIRTYRRNGTPANYEEEGRKWFATFLPRVLMETGVNVPPRVARWRAEAGVDNVLRHIEQMRSSSARRAHYQSLLDTRDLVAEDLDKVIRSASANLTSASDLRAVLTRAAPRGRVARQTISALERALTSIRSSSDQAAVAQVYGQTDDRDMLLAVMRVVASINSVGDRSRTLQVLAPRYLTKSDRELEKAYFDAVQQMSTSSGDQRNVLMVAMSYAAGSTTVAQSLIDATRTVQSSGDRSMVLISLAHSGALVNKSLRDAFFRAAEEVSSEGDRARVLQAAANLRP